MDSLILFLVQGILMLKIVKKAHEKEEEKRRLEKELRFLELLKHGVIVDMEILNNDVYKLIKGSIDENY